MWHKRIMMVAVMVLLPSCMPGLPGGSRVAAPPAGLGGEAIDVTPLDGPAATSAVEPSPGNDKATDPAAGPRPKPRPGSDALVEPNPAAATEAEVTAAPEIKKSRDQLQCEKRGGQWSRIGDGDARTCVKPTRDGGKFCKKQGDCQSECLARSMTCAPFDPLVGCNDVLQSDGRTVTLCVD